MPIWTEELSNALGEVNNQREVVIVLPGPRTRVSRIVAGNKRLPLTPKDPVVEATIPAGVKELQVWYTGEPPLLAIFPNEGEAKLQDAQITEVRETDPFELRRKDILHRLQQNPKRLAEEMFFCELDAATTPGRLGVLEDPDFRDLQYTLLTRNYARAYHAYARSPSFTLKPLSQALRAKFEQLLSSTLDLLGAQTPKLEDAFLVFACGQMLYLPNVFDPKSRLFGHGGPNGLVFLLFAELAFLAHDECVLSKSPSEALRTWCDLTPTLLACCEIFGCLYHVAPGQDKGRKMEGNSYSAAHLKSRSVREEQVCKIVKYYKQVWGDGPKAANKAFGEIVLRLRSEDVKKGCFHDFKGSGAVVW